MLYELDIYVWSVKEAQLGETLKWTNTTNTDGEKPLCH
jgi:hypothetical protein